jgi:hypothetical protein
MRSYDVVTAGVDEPLRLKASDSGRVVAVIDADEARRLWINLGAALGLGTERLTVKQVQEVSGLKSLAKRLKKAAAK